MVTRLLFAVLVALLAGCYPETPARPDFNGTGLDAAAGDRGSDEGASDPDGSSEDDPDNADGAVDADASEINAEPDGGPAVCRDGDTRQCGSARGVCFIAIQQCIDGQWAPCSGLAGQGEEVCDGADNDCDGTIDDGLSPYETRCGGVGACAAVGTWRCEDGVASDDCTPGEAADETCNGVDDDCDGTVDEAVSCVDGYGPCGQGACVEGACVYPGDGDPCDSELPCGELGHACQDGLCLCDCGPEPFGMRGELGGISQFRWDGTIEFHTHDGQTTGPLYCVADWLPALEEIRLVDPDRNPEQSPSLRNVLLIINRPCAAAQPPANEQIFIERAEDFEAADSVWQAFLLGLAEDGSLIYTNSRGEALGRLNIFDMFITEVQPRERCDDYSSFILDGRTSRTLGIEMTPGNRIGTLRVASDVVAVDVEPDLSNWDPSDFPHETPLTITITNPCSDSGERFHFGSEALWQQFKGGGAFYPEFRATFAQPETYYTRETETFLYLDESQIVSYVPAYDDCIDTETIVIQGNRHIPGAE